MADYKLIKGGFNKTLNSGDKLENVLIDGRNGGDVTIRTRGSNWVIRNIGFIGGKGEFTLRPTVTDKDGKGLIENVFAKNTTSNFNFIHSKHRGHIDYKNCVFINNKNKPRNKEDWGYFSPPSNPDTEKWVDQTGKDRGQKGTVGITGCYGKDIGGYGYRLGSEDSFVKNSVIDGGQVGLASLYDGPCYFENCDIKAELGIRIGTHIDNNADANHKNVIADCKNVRMDCNRNVSKNNTGGGKAILRGRIEGNPDLSIPKRAPKSAIMAAKGEVKPIIDTDSKRRVTINGIECKAEISYEFDANASTVEGGKFFNPDSDVIDGRIGKGSVWGGVDDYYVDSATKPHIDKFEAEGDKENLDNLQVFVDGEKYNIDKTYTDEEEKETPNNSKLLKVVGPNEEDYKNSNSTNYEIDFDGEASTLEEESKDTINNNTIKGRVNKGNEDSFKLYGNILELRKDNPIQLYVDNELIYPPKEDNDETSTEQVLSDLSAIGYKNKKIELSDKDLYVVYNNE